MAKKKIAPLIEDGAVYGYASDWLSVQRIDAWHAKAIIKEYHYSKRVVNNSRFHLGIFEGRKMVGVMSWGYALNPSSGASVVEGTENHEYLELNRLWMHDSVRRNGESHAMRLAISYIRAAIPQVKWLQSFADERCSGYGVVYQACNFVFAGEHVATFFKCGDVWLHNIALTTKSRKAGGNNAKIISSTQEITKHRFRQFRYLFFIDRKAIKRLRKKILPYPKPRVALGAAD